MKSNLDKIIDSCKEWRSIGGISRDCGIAKEECALIIVENGRKFMFHNNSLVGLIKYKNLDN